MPVATIQTPDGKTMTMEVPEGATEAQILSFAQQSYQPQQPTQEAQQPSIMDSIKSGITTAGQNIASGLGDIFTDPTAGVRNAAGVADTAYTPDQQQFMGQEMSAINRVPIDLVDSVPKAVNAGLNMAGSESRMPTLGGALAPYGVGTDRLPEGPGKTVANLIGSGVTMAGSVIPVVQRNLATVPGALAEFTGFGSAQSPSATASNIASTLSDSPSIPTGNQGRDVITNDIPLPFPKGGIEKAAAVDAAVKRKGGEVVAAGFKLDDAGNVIKDAAQAKAIKAGIDKGIVAQVAASTKADKGIIERMVGIAKKGLQDKTYADFNLPRQVLGDSLHGRYAPVKAANMAAGKAVQEAVIKLKSVPIDGAAFDAGPVRAFSESLSEMGVKISRTGKVSYRGSDFEGTEQARKIISQTVKRIYDTDVTTLKDAHRLKKFIDNMADEYGNSAAGLSGSAQRVVKELRHNTNQFIREFAPPEYASANDTYSESIDALNRLDKLIGKGNSVTPTELARTARKALSNAQKSGQVMKVIEDLDSLAQKYGSVFDDNFKTQMSVVQSIEKMFPSTKPSASFGGEIDKSLDAARRAASQSTGTTLGDIALYVGNKAFSKTPTKKQEELIAALEELIASGQK
jgi:hypothetical protein